MNGMEWHWIVVITVVAVHAVNFVVILMREYSLIKDDTAIWLTCTAVWLPLKVLLYPPLKMRHDYKRWRAHYQKHGISYIAYLFGKRVK